MIDVFAGWKAQSDSLDPRLWPLLVALLVGAAIHAWKAWHPKSFEQLPGRFKALPATLLGIVVSVPAAEWSEALVTAVIGAFSGLMAVGGQETLSRLAFGSKAERVERKRRLSQPPPPKGDTDKDHTGASP